MKKKKSLTTILTLDLHGFLVDEVYDAIEPFLAKANKSGQTQVRIITGKGTGKVRAKTLEYLKTAHYQPKEENEGSFLIVL